MHGREGNELCGVWHRPIVHEPSELLFLTPVWNGRDTMHERLLRPLAALLRWPDQRKLWRTLRLRGQDEGSAGGASDAGKTVRYAEET